MKEELLNNPSYFDIVQVVWHNQKFQKNTIADITRDAFRPVNYELLTATPEYKKASRYINDLEEGGILKKVAADRKKKIKTHYVVNKENFIRFVLKQIKEMSDITNSFNNHILKSESVDNPLVISWLEGYYDVLSKTKLDREIREVRLAEIGFYHKMTLLDSIIHLGHKVNSDYLREDIFGDIDPFSSGSYFIEEFDKKIKKLAKEDKEKEEFLLFFVGLKQIIKQYPIFDWINASLNHERKWLFEIGSLTVQEYKEYEKNRIKGELKTELEQYINVKYDQLSIEEYEAIFEKDSLLKIFDDKERKFLIERQRDYLDHNEELSKQPNYDKMLRFRELRSLEEFEDYTDEQLKKIVEDNIKDEKHLRKVYQEEKESGIFDKDEESLKCILEDVNKLQQEIAKLDSLTNEELLDKQKEDIENLRKKIGSFWH